MEFFLVLPDEVISDDDASFHQDGFDGVLVSHDGIAYHLKLFFLQWHRVQESGQAYTAIAIFLGIGKDADELVLKANDDVFIIACRYEILLLEKIISYLL